MAVLLSWQTLAISSSARTSASGARASADGTSGAPM
jgi:hypothetical protein